MNTDTQSEDAGAVKSQPADDQGAPATSEETILEDGIEKIVVSRERTPRNPRWQRAWWQTLVRYNARLSRLRHQDERPPDK